FGPIHRDQPVPSESVVLDHFYTPATLEKAFGVDVATLRAYNPALRPAVWNNTKYIPRGFELRLPPDTLSLSAAEVFAAIPPGERKAEQHRDRFHKVRRGDTLSTIARRYRVRERELVTANNLRSRHRIRAGQVLVLPDHAAGGSRTVARSARPADGIYRVRRGDSLSIIARRFGVSESSLVAENSLRNRHRIAVGQRLRIPGAKPVVVAAVAPSSQAQKPAVPAPRRIAETPPPAPDPAPAATPVSPPSSAAIGVTASRPAAAAAPGTALTAAAAASVATPRAAKLPANVPIPDPSDYAVGGGNRITVQATETLGHYAEWLEIATSRLRRLNGMRYNTPVVIGRKIKLDFSRVTPETFEIRRLEHHHTLQEEYFSAFEVTGTRGHVLRPGDSLWYLALQKYQVPIWLIRQFNPDVDLGSLRAGTRLVIPEVSNRTS
ncbi:MAG: LysM peptidoglycan-binding domain-containing protein, partial [Myxococcota bacterium]